MFAAATAIYTPVSGLSEVVSQARFIWLSVMELIATDISDVNF